MDNAHERKKIMFDDGPWIHFGGEERRPLFHRIE